MGLFDKFKKSTKEETEAKAKEAGVKAKEAGEKVKAKVEAKAAEVKDTVERLLQKLRQKK